MVRGEFEMVIEYIKSDLYRYNGKVSLVTFLKAYRKNRRFRYSCWFRLCKSENKIVRKFALWVYEKLSSRSLYIRPEAKIGYGLFIGHYGSIAINGTAVIGDNCNIAQGTTIGSNEEHAATIGNNVYIGPNVCIVEDVHIGDNVTIGAGSVVTKSIPDNATAVGNYAKVINYNNPGRYVTRRWDHEAYVNQRKNKGKKV